MFSECLSTVKLQPLRSRSFLNKKLTFFSCNSPGQRPVYWCMILKVSFPLTFYKCSAIFVSLLTPSSLGHNVPRQILRQLQVGSHTPDKLKVSQRVLNDPKSRSGVRFYGQNLSLWPHPQESWHSVDIYQIKVGGACRRAKVYQGKWKKANEMVKGE